MMSDVEIVLKTIQAQKLCASLELAITVRHELIYLHDPRATDFYPLLHSKSIDEIRAAIEGIQSDRHRVQRASS